MRKEFTAISAFSTLIAFTAGAVLCMQISNMRLTVGWGISAPVVWALEAAIFGAAVYLWRREVSFFGWLLGIAGLLLVRAAVTSSAALGLALMRESENVGAMMHETTALVPRLCAALFALMVCYPLRVMLPLRRVAIGGRGRRFANSAARSAKAEEGDRGLLIVTVKDRAAAEARSRSEVRTPIFGTAPSLMIEGTIELPLSTVLALLPDDLVTDKALALADSQTVTIPLSVIHPQLREAQVVFSVADLRAWLSPLVRKAIVQPSDSDIETENGLVSLPLELIVPQLPPEALQLPPPSPPAWAELQESERVVFARI